MCGGGWLGVCVCEKGVPWLIAHVDVAMWLQFPGIALPASLALVPAVQFMHILFSFADFTHCSMPEWYANH